MRRLIRRSSWLLALALLVGCEGAGALELRIELIDELGQNAAADITQGTVTVVVRQGDVVLSCVAGPCSSPVQSGLFDLPVPIESLTALTRMQVGLEGGDEPLVGAAPPLRVVGENLETGEVPTRILMTPAGGDCTPLSIPSASSPGASMGLTQARRDAVAIDRRNTHAIVGGISADGPTDRVDQYDRVVMDVRPMLSPLTRPQGRVSGVRLSDDVSFVLGDGGWLIDPQMGPPRAREIALHEGASARSALVGLDFSGFAIVGGEDTARVGWYATTGANVAETLMLTPRTAPLATRHRTGVLVVGGEAAGEPAVEWMPVQGLSQAFDAPNAPRGSRGGWLLHSPNHDSALWIGANGGEATFLFTCNGCPVELGPRWNRARPGATGVRTERGSFWIVGGEGSRDIDIVTWDAERPSIVEGPSLRFERAGPIVLEHTAGIVTVAGGEGPDGVFRADFEQCVPSELDPIL